MRSGVFLLPNLIRYIHNIKETTDEMLLGQQYRFDFIGATIFYIIRTVLTVCMYFYNNFFLWSSVNIKTPGTFLHQANKTHKRHQFSILIKDGIHVMFYNSAMMTWKNIKPKMRSVLQIAVLNVFG